MAKTKDIPAAIGAGALTAAAAGPMALMAAGAKGTGDFTGQAQAPPKGNEAPGIYSGGITTTNKAYLPWISFLNLDPQQRQQVLSSANLAPDTIQHLTNLTKGKYTDDFYAVQQGVMNLLQGSVGQEQATAQATGQAAGTTTTGVQPAYSPAALNEYTKQYMMPLMQLMDQQIQGDMNQWGAALQNMGGMAGGSGPISKLLQGEQQALAPQYKLYADALAKSMISPGYLGAMNQAISGGAAAGAKEQIQGSAILNLLQMLLTQPGVQSVGTAAGAPTISPTTIQSLLGGLGGSQIPISGTGVTPTTPGG